MTWRERALLALAIVGFVVPHAMGLALIPFVIKHGLGSSFFTVFMQTLPSAQLAADVIIAFLAFALWAAWEGRRLGMRTWWLPIPASAIVAFCFAVPLFLLLRERALRERQPSEGSSETIDPLASTKRPAEADPASA